MIFNKKFLFIGLTFWADLVIIILLLAVAGVYYYFVKPSGPDSINLAVNADILFEKSSGGWGNCPPNDFCNYKQTLYSSGELVENMPSADGNDKRSITSKHLTGEQMTATKDLIEKSGIMQKSCIGAGFVTDYSATYTLNFNGQNRKISFPNCEEELKGIEKLISG